MKFLIDAQLPHRLARWLQTEGHEAVHTQDLPKGNRTGDTAINELSVREQRTVVTKDEDFVDMFLLRHQPVGGVSRDICYFSLSHAESESASGLRREL